MEPANNLDTAAASPPAPHPPSPPHDSPSSDCDVDDAFKPRPERSSVVPPYWHRRQSSRLSVHSTDGRSAPIGLEDHTDEFSDHGKILWAKSVSIDDYVVVSGSAPGLGAYVVWNCTVETLHGGPMKIRKRYSEFEDLRAKLVQTFPHAVGSMPQFPPKSVVSRFRPRFLERRKQGLSYFLKFVGNGPEYH